MLFLNTIPYYVYTIWVDGKTKKRIRLFKYRKPTYMDSARVTFIYVGRSEFFLKYKGNKYTIPTNYVLDLNRP